MNIDAAKNLVTKVLKNAYNEENFRELVHNLFDHYTPLQEHPVSGADRNFYRLRDRFGVRCLEYHSLYQKR